MKKITGKIQKIKSGNAFFISDELDEDVFIPSSRLHGAMNGDIVEVSEIHGSSRNGKSERLEGAVHKIIERSATEVVGRYTKERKNGYIVPITGRGSESAFVPKGKSHKAKNGDMVVGRIIKYPHRGMSAEAEITEIIAKNNDPDAVIDCLIRANGLNEHFPSEVEKAAGLKSKELLSVKSLSGRRDLRSETIITIDGADSKDLDDAVSVTVNEKGNYVLGVHIADVSHYVKSGSVLDKEAIRRGTSVYLLNKVIPMLPKPLSNGICSLFEGTDRLTLSCVMEIDNEGKVVDHDIFKSVINSSARMVYDDVSDMLEDNDASLIEKYSNYNGKDIYSMLKTMRDLAQILNNKRMAHGSIDFDIDEADITLDDDGVPIEIALADRRTANRIIEEFMLLANETVAEHFFLMNVPFIYRVHDKPEARTIEEFRAFLDGFGLKLDGKDEKVHPAAINKILEQIKGKPYEKVVSTVTLRSMTKAYYSAECGGHFGLAFRYYCHFTSPIRRYPDLMIHRIIKTILSGKMDDKHMSRYSKQVENYADLASKAEIQAQNTERTIEKIKMAEYMSKHIGEEYDAVISGAANFAIFAELPNTVEGTIRLESLRDDYYEYDDSHYCVHGDRTGKVYGLGMPVRIRVISTDAESGSTEFALVD
ncbi:MAG: ribonuclease R [Eubacteriales bacterium]|nr:ribonuclease R [Eubacteriales bacterium]